MILLFINVMLNLNNIWIGMNGTVNSEHTHLISQVVEFRS